MRINVTKAHSTKPQIRKRHWCLGTLVVLVGSWITHTSTAKITGNLVTEQALEFASSPAVNFTKVGRDFPAALMVDSLRSEAGPMSKAPVATLSPALHLFEVATTPALEFHEYTVKRGDTLGKIFKQQGIDLQIPHNISQHEVAKQLIKLRVGAKLSFGYDDDARLKEISYPASALENLVIELDGPAVASAELREVPFQTVEHVVSGEIYSSLYEAALAAGMSTEVVMEMVRIFGWDIDFVLDIRNGDSFHVVFEEFQLNGKRLASGPILAAEFTTQNQTYRAIRYTDKSGEASYYTPEGESMLGTFLRSPVEFSRISSRFGKRLHPILKTWRAHKGVDYAASRGTPIRATADGKVIHAGNKGGYGKAIILRHAGRFSTLYAHMNGFAKDVRSGARVKQGQVIGYVGSTGLATGPHLHYEFRLDGVHRNPLTYKTPKASSVAEDERIAFDSLAKTQLARLDSISQQYQVAKLEAATAGETSGK